MPREQQSRRCIWPSQVSIGMQGAKQIAAMLKDNTTLAKLALNGNDKIGARGTAAALHLWTPLPHPSTLPRLRECRAGQAAEEQSLIPQSMADRSGSRQSLAADSKNGAPEEGKSGIFQGLRFCC